HGSRVLYLQDTGQRSCAHAHFSVAAVRKISAVTSLRVSLFRLALTSLTLATLPLPETFLALLTERPSSVKVSAAPSSTRSVRKRCADRIYGDRAPKSKTKRERGQWVTARPIQPSQGLKWKNSTRW